MSNSKSAGIYSITSKVNGKRYIGSSNRICVRWGEHLRDLKNNKHHSDHLQNHYVKYGEDDLLFAVVEVVERGDLSLQDFKNLLLEREQVYLDNWNECQFNCIKTAGSPLGYKHIDGKYYSFNKKSNKFKVRYKVSGKELALGHFTLEQDAQKQVEFIKTLTEEELLKYWETNYKGTRSKNPKNYCYKKTSNLYYVSFKINSKTILFGSFRNEQDAINEASYLRDLSDQDKLIYFEDNYANGRRKPLVSRRKDTKGYYYNKEKKKWEVCFSINDKTVRYGKYNTEEEAKARAGEVKKELEGFYY